MLLQKACVVQIRKGVWDVDWIRLLQKALHNKVSCLQSCLLSRTIAKTSSRFRQCSGGVGVGGVGQPKEKPRGLVIIDQSGLLQWCSGAAWKTGVCGEERMFARRERKTR